MFDRITRFLGSIKLAVPLLSVIIGILIWATFYESEVGTTTVQQEIYKSPWFGALMFMLAMNLGASALSRYPWRGARKVGFALTHVGLIVIIAGSAAVIHLGVEGMLLVRTDSDANSQIRIEGDTLEVLTPEGKVEQGNIFIKDDGSISPKYLGGLELEAYSDEAVRTVNFIPGGTVANPAVTLKLYSDRMGQTTERSLAVAPTGYNKLVIGPAELEIIKAKSDRQLKELLSAPAETKVAEWGEVLVAYDGVTQAIDIKQQQDKTSKVGDLAVNVLEFFPDFRLDDNKRPVSVSQELNNPAVILELKTSSQKN